MNRLVGLGDRQLKLQNNKLYALKNALGVIKRECIAIEVFRNDDSNDELLKPGNLIQILSDRQDDECHFKIWDFTNCLEKYKTTIYKCSKNDYIVVPMKLWPYLFAIKNDKGRVLFVQNVYNRKFDVDLLKLGCEIQIRTPLTDVVKYYQFLVTYNGVMVENGTGYYIGLQFKNDCLPLDSELQCFSHCYRFGGKGIVVAADWIMMNLYKEEIRQAELLDDSIEEAKKINEFGDSSIARHVIPSAISYNATDTEPTNYNVESENAVKGYEIIKSIFDNRDNQSNVDSSINLCCCRPLVPNCLIVLECKHKFCRTFIKEILKVQLQCVSRLACPMCFEEIDESQIKCLADQMEADKIVKCQICSNQSDMQLALCRHSFCHKCILHLIKNQASDACQILIYCTTCNDAITDSDISRYGGEEIYELFKLKIQTVTIDQILEEDQQMQRASLKWQSVLEQCDMEFVWSDKVISEITKEQDKPQTPIIRNTKLALHSERETNNDISDDLHSIDIEFGCDVCGQAVDQVPHIILTVCKLEICRKCLRDDISDQMKWVSYLLPTCPLCAKDLDQFQLDTLKIIYKGKPVANPSQTKMNVD